MPDKRDIVFDKYSKYYIYAGGIVLHDDDNIYVIQEDRRNIDQIIDPGGKYLHEDINIKGLMLREFYEETYYSVKITYWNLEEWIENSMIDLVYTCFDKNKKPMYVCAVIHVDLIKNFDYNKVREVFRNTRNEAIEHNKCNNKPYNSKDFLKLPKSKILLNKSLDYRLRNVIQQSNILNRKT